MPNEIKSHIDKLVDALKTNLSDANIEITNFQKTENRGITYYDCDISVNRKHDKAMLRVSYQIDADKKLSAGVIINNTSDPRHEFQSLKLILEDTYSEQAHYIMANAAIHELRKD